MRTPFLIRCFFQPFCIFTNKFHPSIKILSLYFFKFFEIAVYLHDIGKIRGLDNHAETGAKISEELLKDYPQKDLIVESVRKHNKPSEDDCVEVKLIAAADAIGHLISPFNEIYFWENPDRDVRDIMAGNLKKAEKDWKRILLPEGREMEGLKKRYSI